MFTVKVTRLRDSETFHLGFGTERTRRAQGVGRNRSIKVALRLAEEALDREEGEDSCSTTIMICWQYYRGNKLLGQKTLC